MAVELIKHASLFSGVGGFDLAAKWVGWENIFNCEIDPFCRKVLKYHFPKAIQYEDITTTDFRKYSGQIDIITGGFPCQPFSSAGKRKGADDNRYLWPEMLRVIREIHPTWVIGENVTGITSMVQPGYETPVESQAALFKAGDKETLLEQEFIIETICRDIESEGYSIQPILIPACGISAPHRRNRIWFVAYSDGCTKNTSGQGSEAERIRSKNDEQPQSREQQTKQYSGCCEFLRTASDTTSDGLQERLKKGFLKDETENETRLDNRFERHGSIGNVTNSYKFNGYLPGFCTSQLSQFQPSGICENYWRNFPSESPVCCGNDGISSRLDGITFSKWRVESVKAYGNAIVPQVAYQIFLAINEVYNYIK